VEFAERVGYESIWFGDHVAFTGPIQDALTQIAHASAYTRKLTFGTAIYLLPLRHPGPVAKTVSTLDRMCEGRLILGLGIGGEFPKEFAASGVPVNERAGRLTEGIEVLRKLWTGEPVAHEGKYFSFPELQMLPTPLQPGGPPIWLGGRQKPALMRAGRLADGYLSYVVSPEMYREALNSIAEGAEVAGRTIERFDTAHLLFARIDDSYEKALDIAAEHLSTRYGMDFRRATERYCAVGTAADVAEKLAAFHDAGMRYFVVDMIGPDEERFEQLERFMTEMRKAAPEIVGG
jgi:alkanesulfonate monooxygenase SsuD/methylene tetrahydromethanopterin reductase-like flavin-dependent oxidoreductase (luciferase family)